MSAPETNFDPPFDITRCSHLELLVADLDESLRFYTEVIGLFVTLREPDVAYLRGLEEACHHSVVLRRSSTDAGKCTRLGFRVFRDGDLDPLHDYFVDAGLPAEWVDVPYQDRTLHVNDPAGTPLEFCASMPVAPRLIVEFSKHKGAAAHRIDHLQLHTHDVRTVSTFHTGAGFRISEYIAHEGAENMFGAFLQRKGNPHDLVYFEGLGPRLHHFAFTTPDAAAVMRCCDIAGELGYGSQVERGPGRHGPGHAQFAYLRDPDGHRVEVFTTHYQIMDIENEPKRWTPGDPNIAFPWGFPARQAWFDEATEFVGVTPQQPANPPAPLTLERYLAEGR